MLIEKGVKVIIPINALHTHPDFYANPEVFDPERFDESKGGAKRLRDAGVFMPFGSGPRSCLGNSQLHKNIYVYLVQYSVKHNSNLLQACDMLSPKSKP